MSALYKNFRIGDKALTCPLCHRPFRHEFDLKIGGFIWSCAWDRIAIRVEDSFCGRWEELRHRITAEAGKLPCPTGTGCDGEIRCFATRRGFMKTLCIKCGASLTCGEPERKDGDWTTPENPGIVQQ